MIIFVALAAGSMGPKVEAACDFVESTGGVAGIGALSDGYGILAGMAGTTVDAECSETELYPVGVAGERGNS